MKWFKPEIVSDAFSVSKVACVWLALTEHKRRIRLAPIAIDCTQFGEHFKQESFCGMSVFNASKPFCPVTL